MQYTNLIQHLILFIENNNNEKKWKPFQAKMKNEKRERNKPNPLLPK